MYDLDPKTFISMPKIHVATEALDTAMVHSRKFAENG